MIERRTKIGKRRDCMRKGPCLIPTSQRRRATSIGVAIVAAVIWSGSVLAEEPSITAFRVWQAEAPSVMTGEHQPRFTDRKSAVEVKKVSVRVDTGVRGTIT